MSATPSGAFNPAHPSLPIYLAPLTSVSAAVQAQLGNAAGNLVIIETTTAGAMYTVPANKTFTGTVYIQGAGTGSATVSAATGGTLASETFGAGGSAPDAVSVTVAGGAGGNVISLATSGGVSLSTVALIGHVK